MNTFFGSLAKDEKQRIMNLELFDEHEEWHLKCSHYFILCALNGQCGLLSAQILPSSTDNEVLPLPVYGSCELLSDNLGSRTCTLKRSFIFSISIWSTTFNGLGFNVFM